MYANNDFRQLRQVPSTRLNTSRLPSTHGMSVLFHVLTLFGFGLDFYGLTDWLLCNSFCLVEPINQIVDEFEPSSPVQSTLTPSMLLSQVGGVGGVGTIGIGDAVVGFNGLLPGIL